MNNSLNAAKIILRKSKKIFWRVHILFLLMWIIILSYIAFSYFNLSNHLHNFYDNDLAHVIEVKGYIADHQYKKLDSHNTKLVHDLLEKENIVYDYITLCKIANGILIEDTQEGVALYGIYEGNTNILNDDMHRNVLYSNLEMKKIKLIIPEVYIDSEGNLFSDSYNTYEYEIEDLDNALVENILFNSQNELTTFFANKQTFSSIVTAMFKEGDNFVDLEELIINVSDLEDISSVKSLLEENGYFVSYAFTTFEDLPAFIVQSSAFHVIIFVLLLVFSMACIFISYKNYINVQKKDIGVLKHFGYSNDKIMYIYSCPLKINIFIISGVTFIFNLWQYKDKAIFGIVTLFMILLSGILYVVIKRCIIKSYVEKDILALIKYDKEFE